MSKVQLSSTEPPTKGVTHPGMPSGKTIRSSAKSHPGGGPSILCACPIRNGVAGQSWPTVQLQWGLNGWVGPDWEADTPNTPISDSLWEKAITVPESQFIKEPALHTLLAEFARTLATPK